MATEDPFKILEDPLNRVQNQLTVVLALRGMKKPSRSPVFIQRRNNLTTLKTMETKVDVILCKEDFTTQCLESGEVGYFFLA